MRAGGNAPAIIKRKKVVAGGGHHGGAWKVAYADFVTAMMAFFLLMWLLNATTEQQLKGLADYFSPEIAVSRTSGGSDGMFGGDSMSSTQTMADDGTQTAHGLAGDAAFAQHEGEEGTSAAAVAEVAALRDLEAVMLARGGESLQSELALRHVVTRLTDEGLTIELYALPDVPLWQEGTAVPEPVTVELLRMIAEAAVLVSNRVAVAGHVPAVPVTLARNPVWDQSTARAAAARVMLEAAGLDPARIARVTGHADRSPALADDPAAVRNDRIEVTFLREQEG
jgi:chemotaxis protein MotB